MPMTRNGTKADKTCSGCKLVKPLSEFYPLNSTYNDGSQRYRHKCKECAKTSALRYHHAQPPEKKFGDFRKDRNLRYIYGITLDEFKRMHLEQEGKCYLCKRNIRGRNINIDHDHRTGKMRKLLCSNCNTALGLLSDNKQLLLDCASYVEAHAEF